MMSKWLEVVTLMCSAMTELVDFGVVCGGFIFFYVFDASLTAEKKIGKE